MLDEQRRAAMDVAMGLAAADTVIQGGQLVNVHTAEILSADLAISGRYIACVGDVGYAVGPDTQIIDATGRYLTSGLIETHQHVGGTHLSMSEFARAVIPHGTTAIVTDFYEMAIVSGTKGVRFCLDELKATGMQVIFCLPIVAYYQNNPFNNIGTLTLGDLKEMLRWDDCAGINESALATIAHNEPAAMELTDLAWRLRKISVGHAAQTSPKELQAGLIALGPTSDHEAVSAEEAVEKVRLGMRIVIREGSAATDLVRVVKAITEHGVDPRMFAFCTDEDSASRIVELGHLDRKIRMAIQEGVEPVVAVQMATLNAAETSAVANRMGSLVPGKLADVVFVDDLRGFNVREVMLNGRMVAQDGEMVVPLTPPEYPSEFLHTVRVEGPITEKMFRVEAPPGAAEVEVRVIATRAGSLVSEELFRRLPVVGGQVPPRPEEDILKIAVIDRHEGTGQVGLGFVSGFQLREGAIGSVYNPCVEDMVILGTNESDMLVVATKLVQIQGGFVVASGGRIQAAMELPLFGILSLEPLATVIEKARQVDQAVHSLGCPLLAPFHTLAFMAWPGHFGELKMSNRGVARVWEGKLEPLLVGWE